MNALGFVRCSIAHFNSGLSNTTVSTKYMSDIIETAEKSNVDVLVFPELSLTGYTCQDLFLQSHLQKNIELCLETLLQKTRTTHVLALVGAPVIVSDVLYNCAIAIQSGEILGVVPKKYITNHGESSEKRWFSPYTENSVKTITLLNKEVPFGNLIFTSKLGYKVGVEIGEDLWSVIPPSSYLALAGANIIANLSASNELVGKDDYRRELIKNQSSRTISAYLYSSSGINESSSDSVYGGSGYICENGVMLKEKERFSLDNYYTITADIDVESLNNERLVNKTFCDSKRDINCDFKEILFDEYRSSTFGLRLFRYVPKHPFIPESSDERNKVCKEILAIQSNALAKRLDSIKASKVVLGVSGGLDSTLALLVCYEAFKLSGLRFKDIIGITMPGFGTTGRTHSNAVKLCNKLGITLREIPIRDACIQHFKDIGQDPDIHDVTYENSQARERTQILMDVANKENAIVIGTGDLSELAVGWCTYNGDHMSMYNVNGGVPKTLVKYLVQWYADSLTTLTEQNGLKSTLLNILDTPISPELLPPEGDKISQKSENSVGPYELIDFFIYNFVRKRFSNEKILYLANKAFEGKYTMVEIGDYYKNFMKRFFNNQFKRNCVPDGPKVGSVGLSPRGDLKMPSDADSSIWLI